ncbi:MAG TPA: DUF427 domain-containing protein [Solirubrobacteraceae bacterium]|nr:DUF427 domain-containing protein [Solirubrobacteraceae bacterium]
MGLSWQQGPLGRNPNGQFLVPGMPHRALYAEPLRRRMRAELGGRTVVQSDSAVLLFEPGRYPVAYFPTADFAEGALRPIDHRTTHPELGETAWYEVIGDTRNAARGAWQHVGLQDHAAILEGNIALAWRAMDAFYEEDDRILGHAADPYHRIDIRQSSRHLVVRAGNTVIADTTSPVALFESGFAPRWYVPRDDVVADALTPADLQTFCPYKGIASYYDIDGAQNAAWSYRAPLDDMAAVGDLVSFEPDRVEVTLDGERLELEPGQNVASHGIDRNLDIGEAGALTTVAEASFPKNSQPRHGGASRSVRSRAAPTATVSRAR